MKSRSSTVSGTSWYQFLHFSWEKQQQQIATSKMVAGQDLDQTNYIWFLSFCDFKKLTEDAEQRVHEARKHSYTWRKKGAYPFRFSNNQMMRKNQLSFSKSQALVVSVFRKAWVRSELFRRSCEWEFLHCIYKLAQVLNILGISFKVAMPPTLDP